MTFTSKHYGLFYTGNNPEEIDEEIRKTGVAIEWLQQYVIH